MAISIPSDLVLDVVNAADPVERQMAAQHLGSASRSAMQVASATGAVPDLGSGTEPASFEKQYASVAKPAVLSDAGISRYSKGIAKERDPVSEKFVALMLHEMLETMLPRDTEGIFLWAKAFLATCGARCCLNRSAIKWPKAINLIWHPISICQSKPDLPLFMNEKESDMQTSIQKNTGQSVDLAIVPEGASNGVQAPLTSLV